MREREGTCSGGEGYGGGGLACGFIKLGTCKLATETSTWWHMAGAVAGAVAAMQ